MFVRLFYTLRKYGVPVTTRELIDLNQAVASCKLYFEVEPDIKAMEKGLNVDLDKNSINAIPYSSGARFVNLINTDIVISLPAAQVGCLNTFLDEEVCKVFGS